MCYPNCAKYLLVILNIAMFVAGGVIFVAGLLLLLVSGLLNSEVITLLDCIKYDGIKMGILLQAVCYMMIAAGGIIMICSVVGICAAWKKIKCCLLIFVFLVVFIILVQGTMVGLWIRMNGTSGEWLKGELKTLLAKYNGPTDTDDISDGFNTMFMKVGCCGAGHYSDMETIPSPWFTNTGSGNSEKIPSTCCQGVDSDEDITLLVSSSCTTTPQDYYTQTCYDAIQDHIDTNLLVIALVSGIGLIVEVIGIVLTCMVLDQTKNRIQSARLDRSKQNNPPPYIGIDSVLKNKKKVRAI
ncbi:hypothetical protein ACF0H5_012537 [Mactra antiquata]